MDTIKTQKDRFHYIDGIRGIAVSVVVLHHAFMAHIVGALNSLGLKNTGFFLSTFTGSVVPLFFVMSGAVLLRPYLRANKEMKTLDFFWRRLKRVYPPYFFALVFGSVVIWINSTYPTWYNIRGMHVPFTWEQTIRQAGIFSKDDNYYNLAWWSLQIEVAFYLLTPLIIFVYPKVEKVTTRWIIMTITALFASTLILQFLFTTFLPQFYHANVVVQSIFRFIDYPVCFFMGVLLATKDFDRKAGWIMIAAGAVLVVGGRFYFQLMHSGYGLVWGGALVHVFNSPKLKQIFSGPIFMWIGERSYSLYLTHFSVFYLVNNMVSRITPDRNLMYGVLTRGLCIPLSVFAAMLLFHFVERKQVRGLQTAHLFWPWQAWKLHAKQPEKVLEAA